MRVDLLIHDRRFWLHPHSAPRSAELSCRAHLAFRTVTSHYAALGGRTDALRAAGSNQAHLESLGADRRGIFVGHLRLAVKMEEQS